MFQDLQNKPIGLWEEPIIGDNTAEKCKLIFEGKPTAIDIKFKPPFTLNQIPILITTNHDLWLWDIKNKDAFIKRCTFWYFKQEIEFINSATYCPEPTDIDYNRIINENDDIINATPDNNQQPNTGERNSNNNSKADDTESIWEKETIRLKRRRLEYDTEEQDQEIRNIVQSPNRVPKLDRYPHKCDWIALFQKYVELEDF